MPDLLRAYDREAKGIPIGRAAEVNLRNNHTQYIFTWYVGSPFPLAFSLYLHYTPMLIGAQVFFGVRHIRYAVDGGAQTPKRYCTKSQAKP